MELRAQALDRLASTGHILLMGRATEMQVKYLTESRTPEEIHEEADKQEDAKTRRATKRSRKRKMRGAGRMVPKTPSESACRKSPRRRRRKSPGRTTATPGARARTPNRSYGRSKRQPPRLRSH